MPCVCKVRSAGHECLWAHVCWCLSSTTPPCGLLNQYISTLTHLQLTVVTVAGGCWECNTYKELQFCHHLLTLVSNMYNFISLAEHIICFEDEQGSLISFSLSVFLTAMEAEPSPSHLQTKAYVRQLQVIDNQNLLFEMASKLEPKDMWRDRENLQAISTKPLVPDPINPHTHPFIPHCHRSTQLGCQSSQAPPPNHRTRTFVHENGVNCALSDSVSMLIMTTHSGLDSFLHFFFSRCSRLKGNLSWLHCHQLNWTKPE